MMLRASTQMMLCLAAKMKKSKSFDLDFLAGAGGFEPTTHGFGVAQKGNKVLICLAFSTVLGPFPRKTVCRDYV